MKVIGNTSLLGASIFYVFLSCYLAYYVGKGAANGSFFGEYLLEMPVISSDSIKVSR